MIYKLTSPEGRLVLAYHSPKDWAKETQARLIGLGCSEAYAKKVARRIARAT